MGGLLTEGSCPRGGDRGNEGATSGPLSCRRGGGAHCPDANRPASRQQAAHIHLKQGGLPLSKAVQAALVSTLWLRTLAPARCQAASLSQRNAGRAGRRLIQNACAQALTAVSGYALVPLLLICGHAAGSGAASPGRQLSCSACFSAWQPCP